MENKACSVPWPLWQLRAPLLFAPELAPWPATGSIWLGLVPLYVAPGRLWPCPSPLVRGSWSLSGSLLAHLFPRRRQSARGRRLPSWSPSWRPRPREMLSNSATDRGEKVRCCLGCTGRDGHFEPNHIDANSEMDVVNSCENSRQSHNVEKLAAAATTQAPAAVSRAAAGHDTL